MRQTVIYYKFIRQIVKLKQTQKLPGPIPKLINLGKLVFNKVGKIEYIA